MWVVKIQINVIYISVPLYTFQKKKRVVLMVVRLYSRQCGKHLVRNFITAAQTRNYQKNIFGFHLSMSKQAQEA